MTRSIKHDFDSMHLEQEDQEGCLDQAWAHGRQDVQVCLWLFVKLHDETTNEAYKVER